jgi:predicted Kef-type K+ transport protein
VVLAAKLRVPSIVAYLAAGLLLGPLTGLITVGDDIHLISEVGIALLLFLVGLELSLDKIRDVGKVAVAGGARTGRLHGRRRSRIALLLGFSVIEALFLATALTFSSTVVVVKLLDQKKEIDSLYGRIAVGIFLVQDLVVIVALTFLAGLGESESLSAAVVGMGVAAAFGGMALLLLPRCCGSLRAPPRLQVGRRIAEALLHLEPVLVLPVRDGRGSAGLSLEIGAFLAGLSLAQLPYNHDLRRRVHPLMNFFIAVFFVSLGVQMEFGGAATLPSPPARAVAVRADRQPVHLHVDHQRTGYGERTSFLTSVTVAQISEFSFIFAAMGLARD